MGFIKIRMDIASNFCSQSHENEGVDNSTNHGSYKQ